MMKMMDFQVKVPPGLESSTRIRDQIGTEAMQDPSLGVREPQPFN